MSAAAEAEVRYEGHFQTSTAAYARFGRALVEHKMRLMDSYLFIDGVTAVVMVKGTPESARGFAVAMKFRKGEFSYRSPTMFDNGTLRSIYSSDEDELAGRKSEAAKKLEAYRELHPDD